VRSQIGIDIGIVGENHFTTFAIQNVVTGLSLQQRSKLQLFIPETEVGSPGKIGHVRTQYYAILIVDNAVSILVLENQVAGNQASFGCKIWVIGVLNFFLIVEYSGYFVAVKCLIGLANNGPLTELSCSGVQPTGASQSEHLILQGGNVAADV